MLEARELCKRYEDGHVALKGVSFSVNPGEIFCLLGANGAGKTTTINLFLDLIRPTSGQALVGGIEVQAEPLKTKDLVGYVSENVMLYTSLSARQNLRFFVEISPAYRRDRAVAAGASLDALLKRVGLDERAFDLKVGSFSKGMRQKLGIALAIAKGAPALLLDEPTSGLDPQAASELMVILRDLRAEGKAILVSTHDIFRAKVLADKVGIMCGGRLAATLQGQAIRHADLDALYLEVMASQKEGVR